LDGELLSWCGYGNLERVVDLLHQGASPNASNEFGVTALHFAAKDGNVKLIKLLIKSGARVSAKNRSGNTPLYEAAGSHHTEAVKVLLDAGAEPTPAALGQACWLGDRDTALLLLNSGVTPDAGLARAAQGGHAEIVRLLLEKGAAVNYQSDTGFTALHLAALQGGPNTVRVLLEKRANPNIANRDNESPLHLAISGDCNIEVIKLLLAAGAKTNAANKEGLTPVRLASVRGAKDVYSMLLKANDGKEPAPVRTEQSKPTKQLIADLASKKPDVRFAAQRELAGRGKEIMPDVSQSIDSGTEIGRFYELFQAMGPNAEAAIPKLESQLSNKKQVYAAAITIERMKPGALAQLSDKRKQEAAEALYEAMIDPETGVATGVHCRLLIHLGDPAVPTILRLLRNEKPEVRAFVARQFESVPIRNDAIRAELIKLQSENKSPEVRADVARGLRNPNFRSSDAKTALIERLRTPPVALEYRSSDSEREREAANAKERAIDEMLNESARTLAEYGPEMVDELLPLIGTNGDPAWEQYKKVWDNLDPKAVPKFCTLLDHSDKRIRDIAYKELGRLAPNSPEALEKLASRLESAEPEQRQLAADALWDIRGVSARAILPKLLARLSDDKIKVRTRLLLVQAALRLDAKQTKNSTEVRQFLPRMIETATKGEYLEKCAALETLGSLGAHAKDALPQLEESANQPLPKVPPYVQPMDPKNISPERKKAQQEQMRAGMLRNFTKDAIKEIKRDLEEHQER
jgi:ankyrin repeat protein